MYNKAQISTLDSFLFFYFIFILSYSLSACLWVCDWNHCLGVGYSNSDNHHWWIIYGSRITPTSSSLRSIILVLDFFFYFYTQWSFLAVIIIAIWFFFLLLNFENSIVHSWKTKRKKFQIDKQTEKKIQPPSYTRHLWQLPTF